MKDNSQANQAKDEKRILEGPSLGETILSGVAAIYSHPILLLFWLVASGAIVLFNRMTLEQAVKSPLYVVSGLLALLLTSGIMGSMELIIRQKGWIFPAVWWCAKLYFPRFLLLGVILVIAFLIIYIPAYVVLEYYLCPPYFPDKDILNPLFDAATIAGLVIFAFFMTFAGSSIVMENLLPLESIERSFQIVMANRTKVLYLWIIYVGPLVALEVFCNQVLDLEWRGKLLQNTALSYIFLLMMMSIMYFNYDVQSHAEAELVYLDSPEQRT